MQDHLIGRLSMEIRRRLLLLPLRKKLVLLAFAAVLLLLPLSFLPGSWLKSLPLIGRLTGPHQLPSPDFFAKLPEEELLARCIWGEARHESEAGKLAVAHVVLNRLKANSWYGKSVHEIILKPYQFSCFNPDDPNYIKLAEVTSLNPRLVTCRIIAEKALKGLTTDPTKGATHFHATHVAPYWKEQVVFVGQIGNHLFYREEGRNKGFMAARPEGFILDVGF